MSKVYSEQELINLLRDKEEIDIDVRYEPESFPKLESRHLRRLYVYNAKLTSLPEFKSLPNLQRLDVSRNKLTTIPQLPLSLQKIYIYNNLLKVLPESMKTIRLIYLGVKNSPKWLNYTTLVAC